VNTTRIPVADAKRGDRIRIKGDTAVITKVHRPRMQGCLKITAVDSAGVVHCTRYLDGMFDEPTNWTIDIVT
jgi:hypothetical protein